MIENIFHDSERLNFRSDVDPMLRSGNTECTQVCNESSMSNKRVVFVLSPREYRVLSTGLRAPPRPFSQNGRQEEHRHTAVRPEHTEVFISIRKRI